MRHDRGGRLPLLVVDVGRARPARAAAITALININIDPAALGAPALHEVALQADADLALADLIAELGDAAQPGGRGGLAAAIARPAPDYERRLDDWQATLRP